MASGVLGGISDAGDSMGSQIAGAGKFMAAGLAIGATAITGIAAMSIKAAAEAEGIAKATEAVLASTKGVAGMTASAVADLATSLSLVAPFEDDAIQGAQNLLLTFTSIGKDVFPQATETVLNMSQALGQDLKASSIQLGKALNDPIAGVTSLRKVGVALTEAQEKQIKTFMAVGDIMSAQKIILGELETEFGGAAKAAGTTLAGQLTIAQTQLGNVAEAIGGALLPSITPLITAFSQGIPGALEALKPWLTVIGDIVRKLATGDFKAGFDGMMEVIRSVGGEMTTTLSDWGRQLWSWIEPMIPPMLAKAGELAGKLLGWIGSQVGPLLAKLSEWGRELWAWIEPMIPPMLVEAGKLAVKFLDWITMQGPPLATKFLTEWLPAAIGWVAEAGIAILPKLLELVGNIGKWIVDTGLPKLMTFGSKMGAAIMDGIRSGLGKLGEKMTGWILDAIHAIHIDLGWIVIDGKAGVSFDIPTPSIPNPFGGGGDTGETSQQAHSPGGSIWTAWHNAGEPSYALGGIVGGAIGAPQFAMVHGGERVLTPSQQRGGDDRPIIVNLQVDGQTLARIITREQGYSRSIG